ESTASRRPRPVREIQASGDIVGLGDCETRVRVCFEHVEAVLKAVGGELTDIVSLTVYFLDTADLPAV
ncbi:MAG: hypothetical protein AAGF59_09570, partial [Pseudomonadota bacterium]